MDPVDHRPRARDTSHLLSYGLDWIAVDEPGRGSGAYAHPPATGGCATAFEDGSWYVLKPGGKRIDGPRAADENAGRRAAIEALGGKRAVSEVGGDMDEREDIQRAVLAGHQRDGSQVCCFEGLPRLGALRYQYGMMDAPIDAGHPEVAIKTLAPDAHNFEPHSMTDCWLFDAAPIADPPPWIRLHGMGR
jgi:hypothetical protein